MAGMSLEIGFLVGDGVGVELVGVEEVLGRIVWSINNNTIKRKNEVVYGF